MLENLPDYVAAFFGLITAATLILFFQLITNSALYLAKTVNRIMIFLVIWLILQGILSIQDIYSFNTDSLPPKIILFGILPPIATIILLFLTKKGREFIDGLSLARLTYIHIIRIPVEITLYLLYLESTVPELMTFEGRNFDILVGLTAPIVGYFGLYKKWFGRTTILVWNFIGLGFLLNIVINAFLSVPSPIQQFAFEQPNITVLYFPFSWLPTFIVPVMLFAHLVSIRRLSGVVLSAK